MIYVLLTSNPSLLFDASLLLLLLFSFLSFFCFFFWSILPLTFLILLLTFFNYLLFDVHSCTLLSVLDLSAFPATDVAALAALERMTSLRELRLAWTDRRGAVSNGRFSDVNLWESVAKLTRLDTLAAHGLPPPTGFIATMALKRLTALHLLNVSNPEELTCLESK